MFDKFRDLLWPLGATVLALFVAPIAIEQYPEIFKESPWILPLSIVIVCLCWIVPLLVHHRVRRIHRWILGHVGDGFGWIVVILAAAIVLFAVSAVGYKLYINHESHLEARLRGLNHPLLNNPAPRPPAIANPIPNRSIVHRKSPTVRLIFKASPLFTDVRKEHIIVLVDEYCRYLETIGFDLRTEFPPLAVVPGMKGSGKGGEYPGTIYDEELRIGEKSIDDPKFLRALFSSYIFDTLFDNHVPNRQGGFLLASTQIYSNYYQADFTDIAPPVPRADADSDRWVSALWDIRQKHGREFANRALFYAYKQWHYPVDDSAQEGFDEFFGLRFRIGVHIEDNLEQNANSIAELLRQRGITAHP